MFSKRKVPKGYRALRPNEVIRSGDRYAYGYKYTEEYSGNLVDGEGFIRIDGTLKLAKKECGAGFNGQAFRAIATRPVAATKKKRRASK